VIFSRDHKTRDMFDPQARIGLHRKERLRRSWAKLFREEILPEFPVRVDPAAPALRQRTFAGDLPGAHGEVGQVVFRGSFSPIARLHAHLLEHAIARAGDGGGAVLRHAEASGT